MQAPAHNLNQLYPRATAGPSKRGEERAKWHFFVNHQYAAQHPSEGLGHFAVPVQLHVVWIELNVMTFDNRRNDTKPPGVFEIAEGCPVLLFVFEGGQSTEAPERKFDIVESSQC